jgi:general secretion pathway protein J
MIGAHRKPAAAGFTLLEALVVLIITGLVSSVVIQGFGAILATRTSFAGAITEIQSRIIERNIIADALRGVIPDYREKPNVFRGSRNVIQGLTTRPLDHRAGAPRPFIMEFAYSQGTDQTELRYRSSGNDVVVLARWRGQAGAFAYRDLDGNWFDMWPPSPDETLPQTPWLIRVDTGIENNESIITFVASPHERKYRIQDVGFAGAADVR